MNDEALEEMLRRAAGIFDPVPAQLLQTAVDAFALAFLDDLDAELAELTFDSLTGSAAVRGPGQPRLLTFAGAGLTVDLELTPDRIVGQLLPPQPAEVEIVGRERVVCTADALGRFACDRTAAGRLSLRCRTAGAAIVTEWVTA